MIRFEENNNININDTYNLNILLHIGLTKTEMSKIIDYDNTSLYFDKIKVITQKINNNIYEILGRLDHDYFLIFEIKKNYNEEMTILELSNELSPILKKEYPKIYNKLIVKNKEAFELLKLQYS